MNSEIRVRSASVTATLLLLLSACGGAGSMPPRPPPPPGSAGLLVNRVFPALTFAAPVGALQAPGDTSRWFVVEQAGRIKVFANQTSTSAAADFLDLGAEVSCCGEMGLLGVAFHPLFPTNPRV